MSVRANNWAYSQNLPGIEKAVLLALAWCHHEKTGLCNPGKDTIIRMSGFGRTAVKSALKSLQEKGLIRVFSVRTGAKHLTNNYRFVGLENYAGGRSSGDPVGRSSGDPNREVDISNRVQGPEIASNVVSLRQNGGGNV